MSQIEHLQEELLACQTRSAERQNAVRVLVEGRQRGDPWADILARALLCLLESQPETLAQHWLDQLAILAREIVAKHTEIEALQAQVAYFQEAAGTDALTGLANRRAFDEYFGRELASLARSIPDLPDDVSGQLPPFSLMMIDLDHFKQINDTYGHPAGDAVLAEVARRISHFFDHRPSDIVARCGGEEFWICWPAVGAKAAQEKAEEFCRLLAANPVSVTSLDGKTVTIPVTVSIGIGTIEVTERLQTEAAFKLLHKHADQALYWAKQHGRNQAVHHRSLPEGK